MRARKIIAFLIVFTGLVTALLIAENNPGEKTSPVSVVFGERETQPGLQFESTGTQAGLFGNSQKTNDVQNNENLTNVVVQNYLGKFLNNNLSAPAGGFTEEAIQEQIAKGIVFEEFNLDDIRVSDNDSVKSQIAYMESIDSLLKKNFPGFNKNITDILDEFIQRGDSDSLEYLTTRIPNYIGGLLALETPPLWKVYHLQLLNLWQKKLITYKAILDMKNDPLKTYVAIREISNIVNEDLTLQAILIKRYEELNT